MDKFKTVKKLEALAAKLEHDAKSSRQNAEGDFDDGCAIAYELSASAVRRLADEMFKEG
jgi:hypothetical protein